LPNRELAEPGTGPRLCIRIVARAIRQTNFSDFIALKSREDNTHLHICAYFSRLLGRDVALSNVRSRKNGRAPPHRSTY
jgi:hypothetical protein